MGGLFESDRLSALAWRPKPGNPLAIAFGGMLEELR
jgi:hypothetical protein